jgi:hypothetical protein
MIIGLLGRHIDAEKVIESIRHQINIEFGGHLRHLFDQFDWMNRGYLTDVELKRHFPNYPNDTQEYQGKRSDIELVIRRFNKDKLNGRISYTEWLD